MSFDDWFKGSKVVDDNGKPLTVYHGTMSHGFDQFAPNYRRGEQLGFGVHFGEEQSLAKRYATKGDLGRKGKNSGIYKVHLSIKNPLLANEIAKEGSKEYDIAKKLARNKFISMKNADGNNTTWVQHALDATNPQRAEKILREHGHDGVRYDVRIGGRGLNAGTTHKSQGWIVLDPTQIKSAERNNGDYDPNNPVIHMAAGGSVDVMPSGFYSPVEQAVVSAPRNAGNAQAWMNTLAKGDGVTQSLLNDHGVPELLQRQPSTTKQELLAHVRRNKPKVLETVYEDRSRQGRGNNTRFQQYSTPGGDHYREVLLHTEPPPSDGYEDVDLGDTYHSKHWPGVPNVVAHLRMADHNDVDGKDMLLADEVQSDWHQQGRDKGYKAFDAQIALGEGKQKREQQAREKIKQDLMNGVDNEELYPGDNANISKEKAEKLAASIVDRMTPRDVARFVGQEVQHNREYNATMDEYDRNLSAVPNGPFRDTWYQLALKRALKEAADKGYSRLGLIDGDTAARRFGLENHISDVMHNGRDVIAYRHDGDEAFRHPANDKKTVEEHIGRELADKLYGMETRNGIRHLSGLQIKTENKGMKKWYDEILPKYLEKFGRRFGARIGETHIPMEDGDHQRVRYLDITPEMRKHLAGGVAYADGGAVE